MKLILFALPLLFVSLNVFAEAFGGSREAEFALQNTLGREITADDEASVRCDRSEGLGSQSKIIVLKIPGRTAEAYSVEFISGKLKKFDTLSLKSSQARIAKACNL